MRNILLFLSIAGMAICAVYCYNGLIAVKDLNGAIHCCLVGLLAGIFLLGILNFGMASRRVRHVRIYMKRYRRK